MQKLLCLFLFVVVPALVTPNTTTSRPNNKCIVGCKCQEDLLQYQWRVKIPDCDSPLVLTKATVSGINKKISQIYFKNVDIRRIDKDTFDGFKDLELVMIEDSSIGAIDLLAFDLPEIKTISFTRTTFVEVPSLNSPYLEEYIFNDCKLTEVPKLENIPGLSFLNLKNNKIKNIDENVFANSLNLEEVTLTNNSISKLPINLFVNNHNFNTLNADYNPLESFELNVTSELELLSLKSCKLTVFDRNSAKTLKTLTSLTLSDNQISVLPIDAFEVMKDLSYIELSNNKLVELDDNIFYENSQLDRIILDNNNFERLPNFQTKDKYFRTTLFSCEKCNLKTLSNSFENMKNLVTIKLSHNKLKNIEGAFTNMVELKKLFLSHNNISTVSVNSFGNNRALEELDLSHNPLKPLDPVVFASIPSMKKLDVSNSTLTKLWTNHNAVLPSLEQLLIGKNNLSVITSEDLQVAPKLKILDVQANPLKCSRELRDFVEYLLNKPIYSIEKSYIFKTHEETGEETKIARETKQDSSWKQLALACPPDDENQLDDEEADSNYDYTDDDDADEDEEDIDGDDSDVDIDDDEEKDNDIFVMDASVLDERNLNLAKASWILSITSVFILSALVVLTVAVAITLLILKRNKSFNMNNDNLPRLKIPLWNTQPSHKRHSGSVYKPLSEDLSGPRTPIINRYEFKQTPQVHNSLP